jgi:hypothetical protein
MVDTMRDNKQVYADIETLSLENERNRIDGLTAGEREQLERCVLWKSVS